MVPRNTRIIIVHVVKHNVRVYRKHAVLKESNRHRASESEHD